jgi:hypothetical protein
MSMSALSPTQLTDKVAVRIQVVWRLTGQLGN